MAKFTSQEIVQMNREYTFFSWSIQGQTNPIPVEKAEGIYFWDTDGKRYIDFSSQLMNTNIGHQHPKVVKAIQEQAAKLCFVHPGNATEPRGLLGKKLAEVTPGNLKKTFFTLGGAEAVENAIKIARFYTGRHKILARYRSYHGATHGSIALTGDYRRLAVEPAMPGGVHFLDPFCYRCPFGQKKESCKRECVSHLEEIIHYEGSDKIAAIIMEGVVGSNGLIIPPDDYWPRVREICNKYGILLISDEVMSGWGRTGKWFAMDHWGVRPDILTTAKGITTAYVPLGLCATTGKIASYFDDHYFSHGHTYEAHPLTLAPAVAAINEMKRLHIPDRALEMGDYMGKKLNDLKSAHPSIGDVRGIGLFWAVDLVKNRNTRQPFNTKADKVSGRPLLVDRVSADMMKNGVFMQAWISHCVIAPPLIITKEEIDVGVKALDAALAIADREVEA